MFEGQYCISVRCNGEQRPDWDQNVLNAISLAAGNFSSSVRDRLGLRIFISADSETGESCARALRSEGFDAEGHVPYVGMMEATANM